MKSLVLTLTLTISSIALSAVQFAQGRYVSITGSAAEQIVHTISTLSNFEQNLILSSGEIQIQGSPNQNLRILFQGKNLGQITGLLDEKMNTMGSAAFAKTANGSVVITGTLANSLQSARLATNHVLCKKVTTPNFPGFDPISHNRCEIK